MTLDFKTKIGLALGGGAARGLAHIGVLKVLEEEGIRIDVLTGTSMGALVGAIYAITMNTEEVIRRLRNLLVSPIFQGLRPMFFDETVDKGIGFFHRFRHHFRKGVVFTKSITHRSLISEEYYRKVISELVEDIRIEEAMIPFGCVTTDINTGEEVLVRSGPLREAICASCAIPGILPPIHIKGRDLVDGGIVNNIPVSHLRPMGARFTIGVNVAKDIKDISDFFDLENGIDIVFRAHEAVRNRLDELHLAKADIAIRLEVARFHWSDFDHFDEYIIKGEEGTRSLLGSIKRMILFRSLRAFFLPYRKKG